MADSMLTFASSYYYQLKKLFVTLPNTHSLKELQILYVFTDPLITGFAISLILSVIFLLVSEVRRNYSQVDRAWSFLPLLFHGHYLLFASLRGIPTGRIILVSFCILVWSCRLTYNLWRKGGYQSDAEDYRWTAVKKKFPANPIVFGIVFFAFNLIIISTWQTIVLFVVTAPTYVLLMASAENDQAAITKLQGIQVADMLFATLILTLVVFQGIADQQQWNYQQAKKHQLVVPSSIFTAADLQRGFVTHGLWKYSRHPNVLCEQLIWVIIFLWSYSFTGFNWSVLGTIAYLLPFLDSARLTESISATKYEQYETYQAQVGMFLPFGRNWKGIESQWSNKKNI